jgi:hypothetical protein
MRFLPLIAEFAFFSASVVALVVGCRYLFAREFLDYHQYLIGKSWQELEGSIKTIILTIYKIAGLGLICLGLILFYYTIELHFKTGFTGINRFQIPIINVIFWSGYFFISFKIHKATRANTPWKTALLALILLIIGLTLGNIR